MEGEAVPSRERKYLICFRIIFSSVGLLAWLALPGPAQEPPTNAPAADKPGMAEVPNRRPGGTPGLGSNRPPVGVALRAGYRWDIPVDFTDRGDISAQHVGAGETVFFPVTRNILGSFDLDLDYVSYAFSVDESSVFAAPGLMRHAADVRLTPMLAGRLNARWGWMARVTGAFVGEADADAWRSFSPGGMVGFVYESSPRLKWTFGLVASALLADIPLAFPMVGFDWRVTDRFRLATRGPGLDAIWTLNPKTSLTLKGRWEYRRYQLADKDPEPNGIFRDQRINVGLEFNRRLPYRLELTLEAGTSVYQQYLLENSDADTVERINTDPQAYLGARLNIHL
jgi:hypothetical protein